MLPEQLHVAHQMALWGLVIGVFYGYFRARFVQAVPVSVPAMETIDLPIPQAVAV